MAKEDKSNRKDEEMGEDRRAFKSRAKRCNLSEGK